MKDNTKIILIISLLAVLLISCFFGYKNYIKYRSEDLVKPTHSEEINIYRKLTINKFVNENKELIGDIGLDITKPLKGQKNIKTGDDFEKFFEDKSKNFKKNVDSLYTKSNQDKSFKYTYGKIDSQLYTPPKGESEDKSFVNQNKGIESEFKIDYRKVRYILERVDRANKYIEHKLVSYKPSEKEIDNYIDKNKESLYIYKFFFFEVDSKKEAEEFISNIKSDVENSEDIIQKELRNTKISSNIVNMPLYSITNKDTRDWLTNKNRNTGDIGYIRDSVTDKYIVIIYIAKFLDESNSYSANFVVYSDSKNAKKALSKIEKSKNKQDAFKSEALKAGIENYTMNRVFSSNAYNKDVFEWLRDPSRKKDDINLFSYKNEYVLVMFNKKNEDSKVRNNAVEQMKSEYVKRIYR